MEYQKIANLIDDTSNQPSKFRTKNWAEISEHKKQEEHTMLIVKLSSKLQS